MGDGQDKDGASPNLNCKIEHYVEVVEGLADTLVFLSIAVSQAILCDHAAIRIV